MFINEINECQTLKEFFSNETVRQYINEKDFDTLYTSINADMSGGFTQALYNSGINPFKYIKEYKTPYKFGYMFDEVKLDEVILPEEFDNIPRNIFCKCQINKLIVLGDKVELEDDSFYRCEFNEIHFVNSHPFINSYAQDAFYNNDKPLKIYIKKVLPDVKGSIEDFVKDIFYRVNPDLLDVVVG